jgi:hypothetical protein
LGRCKSRCQRRIEPSESGYFAVRGMLAKSATEAARFIAERGAIKEGAPVLVRLGSGRELDMLYALSTAGLRRAVRLNLFQDPHG